MSTKTMGIFFMRVIWPFCQNLPPGKKSGYKPKKQFINNKKKAKCMPSKNGIAAIPKRKAVCMNT